jgi:hypothetical protein
LINHFVVCIPFSQMLARPEVPNMNPMVGAACKDRIARKVCDYGESETALRFHRCLFGGFLDSPDIDLTIICSTNKMPIIRTHEYGRSQCATLFADLLALP